MTPDLQNTIASLANKLGVTVEYLWPKLVGNAMVEAWCGVIFGTLGTVVSVFALRWGLSTIREHEYDMKPAGIIASIISAALIILLPIVVICSLPNAIYPEAHALRLLTGDR